LVDWDEPILRAAVRWREGNRGSAEEDPGLYRGAQKESVEVRAFNQKAESLLLSGKPSRHTRPADGSAVRPEHPLFFNCPPHLQVFEKIQNGRWYGFNTSVGAARRRLDQDHAVPESSQSGADHRPGRAPADYTDLRLEFHRAGPPQRGQENTDERAMVTREPSSTGRGPGGGKIVRTRIEQPDVSLEAVV
jgi:hypothetical protein